VCPRAVPTEEEEMSIHHSHKPEPLDFGLQCREREPKVTGRSFGITLVQVFDDWVSVGGGRLSPGS